MPGQTLRSLLRQRERSRCDWCWQLWFPAVVYEMTLASRPASPGTNVPSRNRSAPLVLSSRPVALACTDSLRATTDRRRTLFRREQRVAVPLAVVEAPQLVVRARLEPGGRRGRVVVQPGRRDGPGVPGPRCSVLLLGTGPVLVARARAASPRPPTGAVGSAGSTSPSGARAKTRSLVIRCPARTSREPSSRQRKRTDHPLPRTCPSRFSVTAWSGRNRPQAPK